MYYCFFSVSLPEWRSVTNVGVAFSPSWVMDNNHPGRVWLCSGMGLDLEMDKLIHELYIAGILFAYAILEHILF